MCVRTYLYALIHRCRRVGKELYNDLLLNICCTLIKHIVSVCCFSLLGSYLLFLRLPSLPFCVPRLTSWCFSIPQFATAVFYVFRACLILLPPCFFNLQVVPWLDPEHLSLTERSGHKLVLHTLNLRSGEYVACSIKPGADQEVTGGPRENGASELLFGAADFKLNPSRSPVPT